MSTGQIILWQITIITLLVFLIALGIKIFIDVNLRIPVDYWIGNNICKTNILMERKSNYIYFGKCNEKGELVCAYRIKFTWGINLLKESVVFKLNCERIGDEDEELDSFVQQFIDETDDVPVLQYWNEQEDEFESFMKEAQ